MTEVHSQNGTGKRAALCFVGPIAHPWTQSLRNVLCGLANDGVTDLTLLMSSTGGNLTEGFAIYNLMQSLPYQIHTHNIGSVHSIANVIFIGGSKRTASPESSFMFHGFSWTFGQETLDEAQIAERTGTMITGRAEYVSIFSSRTKWNAETFEQRKLFDRARIVTPAEALEANIISRVDHLPVLPGIPILNVAI
ncbi:ATP-dependent Clp protease proteolytic subunit [Mesorhizobium sp. BE184]|uniref:ClpP family protease n=1 Tax=Mesorhizobium sp. BE184 TaxID=2817714 RepID=UPI0028670DFA|nr:ATP-dependent Clp protease proteolytic subunit [Mesorhizobium sp. BE184]MDR7032933.1 ATP-dependent protease ClpP protease subunit [Mesorhizobium sp. BE184]